MGLHKVPWLKALEFLVHSLKLCKNLSNIRSKFSSWCGYLKSATVGMPRVCNRKEKQRKAIAKLQGKTRSLPWSGREECSKDVTNDVIVSVWWAFWVYNHKELAHIHKFVYNSQWGFLHRSCKLLQKKTENFTCKAPREQHKFNWRPTNISQRSCSFYFPQSSTPA